MNNSADIRKKNKKEIYRFMLTGKLYTKQQVAQKTRLSVATCNTLLNDMQTRGFVLGEKNNLEKLVEVLSFIKFKRIMKAILQFFSLSNMKREWLKVWFFQRLEEFFFKIKRNMIA